MVWEFRISKRQLLYIGWINKKLLQGSTFKSHSGKKHEKECVCVCVCVCIYIYVQLRHFAVQQNLTQHSNQLYFNKIKKTEASKKRNFHRFGDFSQHLFEMLLLTYFFHKIMNKDTCTNQIKRDQQQELVLFGLSSWFLIQHLSSLVITNFKKCL